MSEALLIDLLGGMATVLLAIVAWICVRIYDRVDGLHTRMTRLEEQNRAFTEVVRRLRQVELFLARYHRFVMREKAEAEEEPGAAD